MQDLIKYKESRNKKSLKKQAIDFISAGVGCNCLVALSESKFLDQLLENKSVGEKEIDRYENPICIRSALVTLEKCRVVEKENESFKITEFGRALAEYLGLITIFFDGYGSLVADQARIVKRKGRSYESLAKWPIVSKSSIQISEKTVDPILLQEFENLRFAGTICDLGCGHGVMLSKVCKKTGNPGLGFESSAKTVAQARKQLSDGRITIEVADITRLQGIWEDVVFLMQAFVFHDFTERDRIVNIMNSYLMSFPNLKYFFYVDIVTPSPTKNELFPGFDYVHGLLGRPTRTYEETLEVFAQSDYSIIKEVPIPDLPNTFLWILSPRTHKL